MLEIRIHGRGGQGAVIASKVLAAAFFKEGHFVQAFPAFGVERRGAPVAAFIRVDQSPVRLRCNVYEPQHLIVLDPALTETIDITEGFQESGWILLNTHNKPDEFDYAKSFRVATVDAFAIAIRHHLGSRSTPIVNTAILGAFARCTGLVKIDSVVDAIADAVPFNAAGNRQAAIDAFEETIMYDPQLQTR
ncbi:MAG: 2-oxoacid:acceptor oxidoreductase family protein [Candidatus Latescibacterota bacterium]|nr:MAG: 2-oxoacid:acceptor oxidoreductase family protein [Candidatus Latescibacterota bacterium]